MQAVHRISHHGCSLLSVAISGSYIFAGTQGNIITVHDLRTYSHVTDLTGHNGSVLSLTLSADNSKLFSSSGDSIIRCWCTTTFKCLNVIYSCYDVGDIFATAYSPRTDTLYLGSQNTSLQWVEFGLERPVPSRDAYPTRRPNKFFDSTGPSGRAALPVKSPTLGARRGSVGQEDSSSLIEIGRDDIIQYAHYSYVFCLLLGTFDGEEVLYTGGGDGAINIWSLHGRPHQLRSLCQTQGASILCLAQHESLLYAGQSRGTISVWDLETNQLLRRIQAHGATDVQSLSISSQLLISVGGSEIKTWELSSGAELVSTTAAHSGTVLCSATSKAGGPTVLITGGNDYDLAVWDLSGADYAKVSSSASSLTLEGDPEAAFMSSLRKLISYRSISGVDEHVEDCRRAASFLKNLALDMGAEASLLPTAHNPIVMIKFSANANVNPSSGTGTGTKVRARSVLYYGHYDVISAHDESWADSPWTLTGRNGYLYARGVSDNKAPVLAALYAAHELLLARELAVDLTMLIEGEEESGSRGFREAVKKVRDAGTLGQIDEVFLSNSYWLDDNVPCITYGLRGVIHASVTVSNRLPDLHSGMEGGSVREPTIDLVNLLSKLTDDTGSILIPEFYLPVRKVGENERNFYEEIAKSQLSNPPPETSRIKSRYHLPSPSPSSPPSSIEANGASDGGADGDDDVKQREVVEDLMNRWCRPSLTIHQISVSGGGNSSIIPHSASSKISLRIVPDQDIQTIIATLVEYLDTSFSRFGSGNTLEVQIERTSDWWLSPPTSAPFTRLQRLIEAEWHVAPLIIREGGSIPMVRWLELEFDATAIHFPMGQSSDCAHLVDERLRIVNLDKGRAIMRGYFGA
ncbi:protein of unknown function [Taphrina deformans PYCC 5710]|uniref:Peptidase M20 dimerisation domain-containing protein n=1 Tax=Taphrina deformans (strain PYCC 5710 / ATCC 11124 / CBS 356.35 / IMI 108563 / JCM 9778 / NBRC 8474) TaxID=1097556 RepID=R4XL97_TAPDE|nr:protein of unknown function [Taphrina deformans PYCC 5710]|eukprot:CCG84084.1 protein of unknown function [Taphrina deformans PYCC 5710]